MFVPVHGAGAVLPEGVAAPPGGVVVGVHDDDMPPLVHGGGVHDDDMPPLVHGGGVHDDDMPPLVHGGGVHDDDMPPLVHGGGDVLLPVQPVWAGFDRPMP